jgi:hypothetical protein
MKGNKNNTKSVKNTEKTTQNTPKTTQNREKGKDIKKRLWTIVLYPESAPEDWREIIKQSGIVFAVSPLHDRDINAAKNILQIASKCLFICPSIPRPCSGLNAWRGGFFRAFFAVQGTHAGTR